MESEKNVYRYCFEDRVKYTKESQEDKENEIKKLLPLHRRGIHQKEKKNEKKLHKGSFLFVVVVSIAEIALRGFVVLHEVLLKIKRLI